MELMNMIVLLFAVLCTANADMSNKSQIQEDAKNPGFVCAQTCFARFPDVSFFIYNKDANQCLCWNKANQVVFEKDMSATHDWESDTRECTDMCYDLDSPVAVEYVAYFKRGPRCYCHGVTNEPIFNVEGDEWTEMRKCWNQCSHQESKPAKYYYDLEKKTCKCASE